MSSRCSSNSEAYTSELLEHLKYMFDRKPHVSKGLNRFLRDCVSKIIALNKTDYEVV